MNRSTNTGGADTQGTNRPEIFNVNHLPNNMTSIVITPCTSQFIISNDDRKILNGSEDAHEPQGME
jgi:hypothetical protein